LKRNKLRLYFGGGTPSVLILKKLIFWLSQFIVIIQYENPNHARSQSGWFVERIIELSKVK
jgi:hypothetical protein